MQWGFDLLRNLPRVSDSAAKRRLSSLLSLAVLGWIALIQTHVHAQEAAKLRAAELRLSGLATSNPFDPQRKPWPDAVPVVPPPPPPPVPAPVTEADLQIYGVVVGDTRKAILKLGPRFAGVPARANGFVTLDQGASVGEFVLARVDPDQVLLQAPGGQQWVRFNTKKDRVAAAVPQGTKAGGLPVVPPQTNGAPMQSMAPPLGQPGGAAPPVAALGSGGSLPEPTGAAPAMFVPPATPTSTPPASGAGSLAAAIAAAQSGQALAAPVTVNPFLQLLQSQQK